MRPRVVICGSFHRDPQGLRRLFRELEATGCRILSPISLEFTDISDEVVKTKNESDLSIDELEIFHLRTMRDADFIWLHVPDGHTGISAAYELGFSNALGKPVYCFQEPLDQMLATRVRVVNSVFEALDELQLTL
jgi:nucleoside 2-deoxyribosyltransferase